MEELRKKLQEHINSETVKIVRQSRQDHVCPFCDESDFDLIGLKDHLLCWCKEFNNTPSI